MSRHRAVQLYDEEELDDYEEKSEEDILKLSKGLKSVKAKLGSQVKIPDREITDSLWYYYFDENKTASYLAKTYNIKLNNDVTGSHIDQSQEAQSSHSRIAPELYLQSQASLKETKSKPSNTSALNNLFKTANTKLPTLDFLKSNSPPIKSAGLKLPSFGTSSSNSFSAFLNKPNIQGVSNTNTISAALSALRSPQNKTETSSLSNMQLPSLRNLKSKNSSALGSFEAPQKNNAAGPRNASTSLGFQIKGTTKPAFELKNKPTDIPAAPNSSITQGLKGLSDVYLCKEKSEYADFLTQPYQVVSSEQRQRLVSLNVKLVGIDYISKEDLLCVDASEDSHSDPYNAYRKMLLNKDSPRPPSYHKPTIALAQTSPSSEYSTSMYSNNNFSFLIVDVDQPQKQNAATKTSKKRDTKAKNAGVYDSNPTDAQSKKKSMGSNDAKSSTTESVQNTDVASVSSEVDALSIKPARQPARKIDILKEYAKRNPGEQNLCLVVVGHVDSGKSTLMGRLLFDMGEVNDRLMQKFKRESTKIGKSSFAFAWVLDETDRERERGVTVGVATRSFQTKSRHFTLLDAPGHRDFVPNMISGASQADAAVLVIDSATGGFESGFERNGQTREHAMLVRSLGVKSLIVVVNKMETTNWSKSRFEYIRSNLLPYLISVGFEKPDIRFIPVSGIKGVNLIKRVDSKEFPELASWYKYHPSASGEPKNDVLEVGPCLVELLDTFPLPARDIEKDLRIPVVDYFRGGEFGTAGSMTTGSNVSISGRVVQGSFQVGDTVMVVPGGETAVVKSINVDYSSEEYAIAGDNIIAMLSGVDILHYNVGSVICSPNRPIGTVTRFTAQVAIFDTPIPITKGYSVFLHVLSINESASITRLLELIDKNTGEVIKKSPRQLIKGSTASVEVTVDRPVVIDLFKNSKDLGRLTLRKNGVSIAAGIVTGIFLS